jgi:hypothetical protein
MKVGDGYDFDDDQDGIWYEGTAQMALAFAQTGDPVTRDALVTFLETARDPATKGLYAADRDGLTTGIWLPDSTQWLYYKRLHVGATAWLGLANLGVNPFGNPPVIAEGASVSVTMDEDGTPTPFNLTLHVTDADDDTLTWSISSPASHGTATASGTGTSKTIGYTPTANYHGTDSFVVRVSDGALTDTIAVNVTVRAPRSSGGGGGGGGGGGCSLATGPATAGDALGWGLPYASLGLICLLTKLRVRRVCYKMTSCRP